MLAGASHQGLLGPAQAVVTPSARVPVDRLRQNEPGRRDSCGKGHMANWDLVWVTHWEIALRTCEAVAKIQWHDKILW